MTTEPACPHYRGLSQGHCHRCKHDQRAEAGAQALHDLLNAARKRSEQDAVDALIDALKDRSGKA